MMMIILQGEDGHIDISISKSAVRSFTGLMIAQARLCKINR